MKTLRLVIDLTYDEDTMHGSDQEDVLWFEDILKQDELLLHSSELGEPIGDVKVIEIA